MQLERFLLVFIFAFFSFFGYAQDCTLGLNEKSSDLLIKIFQLNEDQIYKMEKWQAELAIETKAIEDEIERLLASQPQSSPEELTALADKYLVYQQKIVAASRATDELMLSTFNKKQYERYLMLCYEVIRRPIRVVPMGKKTTSIDPE